MEFVILWAGINALIGYLIGKEKNEIGASIALCVLLGPLGWLIAALTKGDLRKCQFCAENVKPEAVVCPHCQRDVPRIEKPATLPKPRVSWTPRQKKRIAIACGITAGGCVIITFAILIAGALWDPDDPVDEVDERVAAAVKLYPPVTPPPSQPAEFVAITSEVTVYDSGANEIKLTPGMRLKVSRRNARDVTIVYNDAPYSIPTAFTEPTK